MGAARAALRARPVAVVPVAAFSDQLWLVLVGVVVWGAATGIQDSTVKAYVASLVAGAGVPRRTGSSPRSRALGALAGGALAGALATHHLTALATLLGVLQVVAFGLLWATLRTTSRADA